MQKLYLLLLILIVPYNAMAAATTCASVACESSLNATVLNPDASCAGSGWRGANCYKPTGSAKIYMLYDCSPCATGTVEKTVSISTECGMLKYTNCLAPCTADDDFVATGTAGYEKKTTCSTSGVATTQYRCAAGWYGASSDGATGCTQCPPSDESSAAAQSSAGTTNISGCYIPAGNSFADGVGAGTYSSNCAY